MLKILIALVSGLLLAIVYLTLDIYLYSTNTADVPAGAAVVLGAAVWSDRPSPVFRERINHAVQLYNEGRVQKLIFTGGLAQGDQLAESEAAREYALTLGVPDQDILLETVSHNTCENLLQARQIMALNGIAQVLVVSDPMHMRRAMWLADALGVNALPSPTSTTRYQTFGSKASFLAREVYYSLPRLIGIHRCG